MAQSDIFLIKTQSTSSVLAVCSNMVALHAWQDSQKRVGEGEESFVITGWAPCVDANHARPKSQIPQDYQRRSTGHWTLIFQAIFWVILTLSRYAQALGSKLIYSKFLCRNDRLSLRKSKITHLSKRQLKATGTPRLWRNLHPSHFTKRDTLPWVISRSKHKRCLWRFRTLTQLIHRTNRKTCCFHRQMRRHGRLEGSFHTSYVFGDKNLLLDSSRSAACSPQKAWI